MSGFFTRLVTYFCSGRCMFSLGRTDLTFCSDGTRMRPPALAVSPPAPCGVGRRRPSS